MPIAEAGTGASAGLTRRAATHHRSSVTTGQSGGWLNMSLLVAQIARGRLTVRHELRRQRTTKVDGTRLVSTLERALTLARRLHAPGNV